MDLDENDIRLLQLAPSEEEHMEIQASLIHQPLRSAQVRGYTALSYTWDSKASHKWIRLDGKRMNVQPNLLRILRKLRALRFKLVWVCTPWKQTVIYFFSSLSVQIDAICINQSDLQECSAQVLRMRAIYADAQSVLVATEAADNHAEELLKILSLINHVLRPENQATHAMYMLSDTAIQTALSAFYNDRYWKRIWIVQEFALGRKVDFLVKDNVVSANKLELLLLMLKLQARNERLDHADIIFNIRKAWQASTPFQFLHVLVETRHSLYQRRHDRVFGLLGLASDALKYVTEPNYEVGLPEIAISMTRSYIERDSLDIILLASRGKASPEVPSWSPDYFHFDRHPPKDRLMEVVLTKGTDGLVPISRKRWSATGMADSDVSFQGPVLQSTVRRIGTIRSLGLAWSDGPQCEFPAHDKSWKRGLHKLQLHREMYRAILRECYTYNPRDGRYDAIWRRSLGYSFLCVFLASHDSTHIDGKCLNDGLLRWIRGNKRFFTGAKYLEDHAKALRHPFWYSGPAFLTYDYVKPIDLETDDIWGRFNRIAKWDMRLMCMDTSQEYGIGWACVVARLHDEVFLLPDCSTPIILRLQNDGKYEMIGDAIVIGAMNDEVWGATRPEDLTHVEIGGGVNLSLRFWPLKFCENLSCRPSLGYTF